MKYFNVALVGLCVLGGSARAELFSSIDYGVETVTPDGLKVCTDDPPAPNHGFVLLLDTTNCEEIHRPPRIYFNFNYNAAGEAKTTRELARARCEGAMARHTSVKVSGLRLYRCNPPKDEAGLSRIRYVVLRPTNGDFVGSWIEYRITLHCPAAGLAKCSKTLDGLLARTRFFKIVP